MRDPAYGDGLLHRAQIFFKTFITFARRHALPCEIVVVEWNPVADAPRFRELLSWPKSLGHVTVRFIDVPAAVHERLPNATVVSIGHRSTLVAFHRRGLTLARDGDRFRVKETALGATS